MNARLTALLCLVLLSPHGASAGDRTVRAAAAGDLLRVGQGTCFLGGAPGRKAGDTDAGPAAAGPAVYREAVDRAVADAVQSFLGDYLSPRALAEAEEHVTRRVEKRPEAFVPVVNVLSLGEEQGIARASVEARISLAAVRGALAELVPPRSVLFVVDGTEGGAPVPPSAVAARLTANLRRLRDDVTVVDPGELESLFEKRPELRRTLGGERGGAELGLRVLAELVCVGTVSADAEETHLDGVYLGTGRGDLRVIDAKTAEVVAAVSSEFRDRTPARRAEALGRAREGVYGTIADQLAKAVPAAKRRGVTISCDLGPIYTALMAGYRTRPFGEITLRNAGGERVGPLTVKLVFEDELLVEPFTVTVPALDPGASTDVAVRGSLAQKLFSRGAQEIAAHVAVAEANGETLEDMRRAVLVYSPNTFSWRDPTAIAAYVDPDDAAVKELLAGVWRALPPEEFPTPELARAAAIYGALGSRGLHYRQDAAVGGIALGSRALNDRVNYPGQSLAEGAGDCDDLVVLFAAALEAAGLPAAVIVGADHVLVAVDTGLVPAAAATAIFGDEGIVLSGGRAWWPLEATALARGEPFLAAWKAAWPMRRAVAGGEADFVEVRSAWETWRPLVRDGATAPIAAAPPPATLSEQVGRELAALRAFGLSRLDERVAALRGESGREADRLCGTLYAACGMLEKAREALARALGGDDRFAVNFNLGLVLLAGTRNERAAREAVGAFRAALAAVPEGDLPARADTLLRLALAYRFAGDAAAEEQTLAQAYAIDDNLKTEYEALFATSAKGTAGLVGERVRRFVLEGMK